MSDPLEPALAVLPYRRLAGAPFCLEWLLAEDNGTPFGAPQDVGGVTAALVTLAPQVAPGVTPPAPVSYSMAGGQVALGAANFNGQSYPLLTVTDSVGQPAGVYELIVALTNGGLADAVLFGTLALEAQP